MKNSTNDIIKCFELPTSSFCLINYADIIRISEVDIINDLDMYDLLNNVNLRSKDVKKVFFHYIIKNVCEVILNKKTKNKAVVFYNEQEFDLELYNYKDKMTVHKFLRTITRKIQSMIPICVYYTDDHFKTFQNKYISKAVLKEKCAMIEQLINDHDVSRYNFAKIKKFASDNNLTYLSEIYFYNMKTKNLMFA